MSRCMLAVIVHDSEPYNNTLRITVRYTADFASSVTSFDVKIQSLSLLKAPLALPIRASQSASSVPSLANRLPRYTASVTTGILLPPPTSILLSEKKSSFTSPVGVVLSVLRSASKVSLFHTRISYHFGNGR